MGCLQSVRIKPCKKQSITTAVHYNSCVLFESNFYEVYEF